MAHAGQEIHGQDGFRLRLVRTAAETGGEVLEMQATYGGTGWLPPEHVHPWQVERFEVLEGTIRTIIGDTERRYGPGEAFEVPAGTPHQMTAEGPSRVRGRSARRCAPRSSSSASTATAPTAGAQRPPSPSFWRSSATRAA